MLMGPRQEVLVLLWVQRGSAPYVFMHLLSPRSLNSHICKMEKEWTWPQKCQVC